MGKPLDKWLAMDSEKQQRQQHTQGNVISKIITLSYSITPCSQEKHKAHKGTGESIQRNKVTDAAPRKTRGETLKAGSFKYVHRAKEKCGYNTKEIRRVDIQT